MVQESELSYLNDEDRLQVYNGIVGGCHHLWSKNKLDEEKLKPVLANFAKLAEQDPYFLAHFTSWVFKNSDSKDLKVVATFVNSLSDADGTPFSKGSSYKKPNLRRISQAALQHLDPKLALRVVQLANKKMEVGSKAKATHYSKTLKTGVKKYLKYRETSMDSIKKHGFTKTVQNLYRFNHQAPSKEVVVALGWEQKPGYPGAGVELKKSMFDFKGLNDMEVAQKIQKERIPPLTALGALGNMKATPVIAAAVLEQCSGDQAVVLTELFERQGLLKDREIKQIYKAKISTAKTALDRVERLNTIQDDEVKKMMKTAKAESRKEKVGDLGKVFLHIDTSYSMTQAIDAAKESGSIIAECVQNPRENFHWGLFSSTGTVLPTPETFEKDAFVQALYGRRPNGGTDCLALYEIARRKGCTTDVYLTDQGHSMQVGNITQRIEQFRRQGLPDPELVVIVNLGRYCHMLKNEFEAVGIKVTEILPTALTESALVAEAIKYGLKGATVVLDEIMDTPLMKLPNWWESI